MLERPIGTWVLGVLGGGILVLGASLNAATALVEPMVNPGVVIAMEVVEIVLAGLVMLASSMLFLQPTSRTPWAMILLVAAFFSLVFPGGPLNIFLSYSLITGVGAVLTVLSGASGMAFRVRLGGRKTR